MKKKILRQRALAVKRYPAGESPGTIRTSLGKTKPWLYKWRSPIGYIFLKTQKKGSTNLGEQRMGTNSEGEK